MKNKLNKKEIVIGIIFLFFGAIILPSINANMVMTTDAIRLDSKQIGSSQSSTDIDWWPMFRHDSGNTGSSTAPGPKTNELRWQKNIGDEIYKGVPIIVENRVYISTNWFYDIQLLEMPPPENLNELIPFLLENPISLSEIFETMKAKKEDYYGGIYCLDAETGEKLWDYALFIPSNPTVINGKVYVTDMEYYGYSSSLYCLDAETGELDWEKPIGGWVTSSSIIIDDDKIYLGCIDFYDYSGTFHCYDLNGNNLWTYTLPYFEFMFFTSPAVCDGRVYFFSINVYEYWEGNLYCLDAETGDYIWSKPICPGFYWIFSQECPVCADGKVFAIDIDIYFYYWDLVCFDAETGDENWRYQVVWSFASPAYYEDSIFIGALDYDFYSTAIYRIDAESGNLIWKAPIPDYFLPFAIPSIADDMIYIASSEYYNDYSKDIYCLSADDGSFIWSYTLDAPTLSTPSIANKLAYIADSIGNVYAFKTNDPPGTPDIEGQINGKPGKTYEYTFTSIDPDGDDIYYFIYWGDGSIVTWDGPYPSGEGLTISHKWTEKDTYGIYAKAKDGIGEKSDWGTLEVNIPRNHYSADSNMILLLDKLTQRFPLLERIFLLINCNMNIFLR